MGISPHALPDNAKNQSSIERVLNLPSSLAERQRAFNDGLKEAQRQGLVGNGVAITPHLDEIKIVFINALGRYEYRDSVTDPKRAIAALKANPKWSVADGVYNGNGKISIYSTATSANSLLTVVVGSLLQERLNAGLSFNLRLTSVENVLQTIAHELAHHEKLGHGDVQLYNKEFAAIKHYRSKK